MSDPTFELAVTYQGGNMLLQGCLAPHPSEFSHDTKFDRQFLASYARNSRQLLKAIKKVSPGFQALPLMIPVFGDTKKWKKIAKKAIQVPDGRGGTREIELPNQPEDLGYDCLEPRATETLHLNSMARECVLDILAWRAHPMAPKPASAFELDEIIYPIAEAMDCVPWLEGKMGLKPNPTPSIKEGEVTKP